MSWNCLNTEERLTEYLEGELPATERALLEAHLADCAACRTLAAQVRWIGTRLPKMEPEVEPRWLVFRILEATTGAVREKQQSWWRTIWAGATSPRFALGVASVAATLFILFQALGIHARNFAAEDLNPVNLYRAADREAHLAYARGLRFVNDMRVVYEIRSRLQEASTTPTPPPAEQEAPKTAPPPQSQHQLKNDLLRRGPTMSAAAAGVVVGGLP